MINTAQALDKDTSPLNALELLCTGGAKEEAAQNAITTKLEAEMTRCSYDIEQQPNKVKELFCTIESLEADNARMKEQYEGERERLLVLFRAREDEVRTLQASVQERSEELARVSVMMLESVSRLDAASLNYREEKDRLLRNIAAARQQNAKLRKTLVALKTNLEGVLRRESAAREQVDAMLSSRSWIVTRPLRRLAMLFHK